MLYIYVCKKKKVIKSNILWIQLGKPNRKHSQTGSHPRCILATFVRNSLMANEKLIISSSLSNGS